MYEARKDSPFYVPLKIFKILWFFDLDPDKGCGLNGVGKVVVLLTLSVLHGVLPFLHLVKVALAYKDISNSEDIADLIGSFGFCFACYKTMYNNEHFNKVLSGLTDTTRFGKPTTFDAEVKKCRLFSTFFLFYTSSGVMLYGLLSKFETRHDPCIRYQAETSDNLHCGTVYPIWIPFDINKTLLFFIQLTVALEIYTPSGQICSMLYEEVSLLVSHMDLFTQQLRNVFLEKEETKRSRKLAYCAAYHSHVIKLALEIDALQRNVTGHLALVWAVSMGCIANQLMSLYKPIGAVLYLLGYLMSLSCFVISGQKLQTESETIAEELYLIPWHLGSIQEQKVVMFMIMRAQIPLTLSAQPFGNYDNAIFVTIVRTAYSYLTLLQSTI